MLNIFRRNKEYIKKIEILENHIENLHENVFPKYLQEMNKDISLLYEILEEIGYKKVWNCEDSVCLHEKLGWKFVHLKNDREYILMKKVDKKKKK